MEIDKISIGALSETAENQHTSHYNDIDFDELEKFIDIDFEIFNIASPIPTPPPETVEMLNVSIPASAELPHDAIIHEEPNNINVIEMISSRADNGGNDRKERVSEQHHDKNCVCLGGSSKSLSFNKKKIFYSPEILAEISRTDPRKAKRIIARRNAVKKSKEKKKNYVNELEKKVKSLQIEADNATAQRVMAKNEASTLANGNKQIKESIEFMIQHQEMQKAFMKSLKEQIQMLKIHIEGQTKAMMNSSFGELSSSQLQLQASHQSPAATTEYMPPSPPLVTPPPTPVGQPLSDNFIITNSSNFNPLN
ncbi:hypothetical protein TSUD_214540 [Trifolium subterraneum]|uniref:BZIP domain-containing protein n=1 Tax=Trifolium subterraneum TaxID=3900 RepID=A0A2Z6P1E2_TRISU|nr:hypothetical protein TSUD_214540 [Trifolium subterraneum]